MIRAQILAVVLFISALPAVVAATVDVSKGFAGAKWGQSPEEVAKETGAKIDGGFEVSQEVPEVIYTKTNADQTVETLYVFLDDKLATIIRSVKIANAKGLSDSLIRNSFDLGEGINFTGNAPIPARVVAGNSVAPPTRRIYPLGGGRQYTFSLTSLAVVSAVGKKYADQAEAKFKAEDLPKILE